MKSQRYEARVFNGSVGVLLPLLLLACNSAETPAEEQIRRWIADAQAAAEAKERRRLVGMISPAYADSRGHERGDIANLLRVYFLRQHSVKLLSSIEDVRVIGDSAAEAHLTVGMAGSNDSLLGFSADAYRFALELELSGDEWQLIAARWAPIGEELR